jgi:hypothetical protein
MPICSRLLKADSNEKYHANSGADAVMKSQILGGTNTNE